MQNLECKHYGEGAGIDSNKGDCDANVALVSTVKNGDIFPCNFYFCSKSCGCCEGCVACVVGGVFHCIKGSSLANCDGREFELPLVAG